MADLSDVKVGDKIAYPNPCSGWSGPKVRNRLLTVDRVTPTQVVCGASKFHKLTGKMIGGAASFDRVEPATQELLAEHDAQVRKVNTWLRARAVSEKLVALLRRDSLPEDQQEKLIELFCFVLEEKK